LDNWSAGVGDGCDADCCNGKYLLPETRWSDLDRAARLAAFELSANPPLCSGIDRLSTLGVGVSGCSPSSVKENCV
jgi:hypothetical protein